MAKKTAILLIAERSEEIETIAVTIAGLSDANYVKCSSDIKICIDAKFADAANNQKYDAVILYPVVPLLDVKHLHLRRRLESCYKNKRRKTEVNSSYLRSSDSFLKAHICKGKHITSYPDVKNELIDEYEYLEDKVVTDGNLITSREPATAFAFGLAIIEKLLSKRNGRYSGKRKILYDDYK